MTGYEIKNTADRGRAMFATRAFRAGETIFEEKPFVSAQFAWNSSLKYRACEYCLKPLETASENVARLANDASIQLPHADCCPTTTSLGGLTACPHCAVEYCSEDCRIDAAQRYHIAICPMHEAANPDHPLNVLMDAWKTIHYPPETTTVMLLVKLVGMYQTASDQRRTEFLAILQDFQDKVVNETDRIAHKMLGANFEQQLATLYPLFGRVFSGKANRHPDVDVSALLTPQAFKTFFAIIGTNGQGLGTSPFAVWVKRVTEKSETASGMTGNEKLALDGMIDEIYEHLENTTGVQFINNEGSALYAIQSKINHSCVPNAQATFPHSDHTLALVAVQDIAAGEEIVISYLDECTLERSRHSRQKDLQENYLFVCQCSKCVEQRDQPDVTSDEDEEDEDDDEDDEAME